MRSWTPTAQAQHGFLVTHNESISIADYFTVREGTKVIYRPTCHYAYHPCDDAVLSLHELAGAQWKPQQTWHILSEDDIVDGIDELGVLLYGHAKNAYWYGSQLSIEETRRLAPYQNATGLQVTSAVLAGIVWMLENPERGIVEADEMDLPPLSRSAAALSRAGGRTLHRLDAARPSRRTVSGEPRHQRPLAVHQRPGELTDRTASASERAAHGRPFCSRNVLAPSQAGLAVEAQFCFLAVGHRGPGIETFREITTVWGHGRGRRQPDWASGSNNFLGSNRSQVS